MSVRGAAIWSMAAQYVAFAVQFVVSVLISRFFLAPAEIGLFSIALAAAMMVSILQDFGITRYLVGQAELDDAHVRTCASVSFLFALAVAGVILALAWPVASFYGEPRLFGLLALIAASYIFVPFSIVPVALLSRAMDFRSIFFVNVGGAIANGAVALGLAALGFSAASLTWALIVQAIVRALIAQLRRPTPFPIPLALKGAMPIVRFGSVSSVLFVSGAIGVRSPDLIIGRLLSLTAVGLYSRGSSLVSQFHTLVLGSVSGIFYPAFARLRDEGQPLGPHYERVVAVYGALVWPAMAMLAATAQPVIGLLYGPVWISVAPVLSILAIAEIAFVALPLHMDLPILLGRIRTLIAINLVDTTASIVLLVVAGRWGIEGAAASRLVYGVIWFGCYAGLMHRLVGFAWPIMVRTYLKSAVLATATVAPVLLSYALIAPARDASLIALLPEVAAGGAIWFAGLFALRHPARGEVIEMLAAVTAKLVPFAPSRRA